MLEFTHAAHTESSHAGFHKDVQRAGNCIKNEAGRYVIAPTVEGRITCLQPVPE